MIDILSFIHNLVATIEHGFQNMDVIWHTTRLTVICTLLESGKSMGEKFRIIPEFRILRLTFHMNSVDYYRFSDSYSVCSTLDKQRICVNTQFKSSKKQLK